jgi:hypothetical protein
MRLLAILFGAGAILVALFGNPHTPRPHPVSGKPEPITGLSVPTQLDSMPRGR